MSYPPFPFWEVANRESYSKFVNKCYLIQDFMAFTSLDTLFPGTTTDVTGITIPYSALSGLEPSEVDAATRTDGREIARALVETMFSAVNALDSDSKPLGMTIGKSNPVGSGLDQVNQNYSFAFTYTYDTGLVQLLPEPTAPNGN